MFGTLIVFLKECLGKVDFEKKSTDDKKHANFPAYRVNILSLTILAIMPMFTFLG